MSVFDWDKAAKIIKESGCAEADAGLIEDWFWTADTIFEDGKPRTNSQAYLGSFWATPALEINGKYFPCAINESDAPGWNEKTLWPESALKILNGEEAK